MEPKLILVDGYNVIKNTPELQALERRSLSAAREALVRKLSAKYRHTPHQVIVVFDAQQTRETEEHVQRVRLIFTAQGVTADSVIARLAREGTGHGQTVVVASNDWEVRSNVTEAGGHVASSAELNEHLNAPPRLLAKRFQHQQGVRRHLQGNDEAPSHHTKGAARRPKKRERGQPPKPPL
ncbi:MAG TPA: NYN domain-containing protein [Ktedonobacterales bacterium]|nr:NYN domain-containing protein [Ktedonobacterales bacterium]